MRLQKYLAMAGVASRRASEELIKRGKVTVNGQIVTVLGTKVDPQKDKVYVDKKPVHVREKFLYLLLYKPSSFITSVKDPQNRPTIMELIPEIRERVFPVGRLDLDTEGLLLLTNDGKLAYRLTHPKYKVNKRYLVETKGVPSFSKLKQLEEGVPLEDGMTYPAEVKLLKASRNKNRAVLEIEIHEGRKRQVKRMFNHIGFPVTKLKRTHLSFLNLEGLKKGQYRNLTDDEIQKLKEKVELGSEM